MRPPDPSPLAPPSTEPLRVPVRPVVLVRSLVQLIFSLCSERGCPCEQGCSLFWTHRAKSPGCGESLLKHLQGIAAGDHHTGREVQRIVQAFDRSHCPAVKDYPVSHRLHAEHTCPLTQEGRQHILLKALKMGIQYVQGHLDRVEPESMAGCHLEHFYVYTGTLVPGEPGIADLSFVLRFEYRLQCATGSKDPVRIIVVNNLMELEEVDPVSLQSVSYTHLRAHETDS